MSFFDDEDDAIEEEPRRRPRSSAGTRPRSGSGGSSGAGGPGGPAGSRSGGSRRPPARDPAIERRRLIAIGVIVVVVILMVVLISSCQARNTKTSLEDYNNSVYKLITQSDQTGQQVFKTLSSGASGATMSGDLASSLQAAQGELTDARELSVPGQMQQAQNNLLLALQMRVDGIKTIANNVQQLNGSTAAAKQAVDQIATGTARFYASDVIYKAYVTTAIAGALHGDNIAVGQNSNIQINAGQFLTDMGWLQPSFIATELGNAAAGAGSSSGGGVNSTQPGTHGDDIAGVAVGSTTLQAGVTNTVQGTPAPTFAISVMNGGDFNQYDLKCTVSVEGGPTASSTLAETTPGNTSTCNVKLPKAVSAGEYQVTVTVSKVPLETNVSNNTATYTVEFQ